ncbi:MAG: hypothetical protein A3I02_09220 [Betaproteobacteria bacterium RIFCSPLOWO2_02_FULL_67_26]|nr:MAG: hypothetical protein A3I02_09220 [Betaproteobacteria bacterium RIFCSPLOWO2_02_FULL_67_26]
MNCHLLVPNLYWPAAAGTEPYRGLEAPALETLLARGHRLRTGGASLERWLAAAYGLPAGLPLAPYALRGDGGDPGDDCWMHADPVHLRVHGDRLVLADATRLQVTPDEARAFIAALGAHFAAEGIAIIAPDPQRWYLRSADEPRLSTNPTAEVAGRSIEPFLPSGDDGAHWRRVINEAQMLLHDHPRNQEREARGELPVNSIWPWGAGRARRPATPYDAVWGGHPLATGLATAGGVAARRLPASGTELLKALNGRSQLVVLSSLPATAYGDLTAWRAAVSLLERDWLAPLLAGLADSGLNSITLHGLGPDFGQVSEYRPRDRLRFWRRTRPLHAYAA